MHKTSNKRFIISICCYLLLLSTRFAAAQTLPLTNYTIQNGLPESTVYAIYLDNAGYLWAGTQSGACSFDGRQFHVYDSQSGLPDNHVTAITGMPDGSIWLGHRTGALSRCKDGQIAVFKDAGFKNTANINSMLVQNNTLYIATGGNGLYAVSFKDGRHTLKHFSVSSGLAADTVNKIAIKSNNEIWVATGKGLGVINTSSNSIVKVALPASLNRNITAVYQAVDGGLWCGTPTGVLSFKKGYISRSQLDMAIGQALADRHINSIRADHNGDIWLSTNKGIAKVSGQTIKLFTKANGLLSDIIYDVTEDIEHGLWLAQDDGISCFKDSPFELYNTNDGLIYNEVYAIAEDGEGNYWIGTAQGITVFKTVGDVIKPIRTITRKDGLLDDFVYDIYRDSRGNMWIACVNKGAVCYEPDKDRFVQFDQRNGLAGKKVVSINEDKRGRIWFATLDNGVAVYNYADNTVKSITTTNNFTSKAVWAIHRDKYGQLWFGTRDKGLVKLNDATDQFNVVPGQNKLANHDFGSISSDSKGNIWIATIGDGVYKYNGRSFERFGNRNGIKSNNPYFIFSDKRDNIWIGTNVGIDHFNPITKTAVNYLRNDGFMGIETNQNAIYQSQQGDLWIGTVNGLMRYRMGKGHSHVTAPLVYITKKHLFFDNDSLRSGKLNHDQNYITFDYLGLSLSNADKIRYQYKLDGLNSKWSPSQTESRVSYANLAPGKYIFQVRAGYSGSNWSKPALYSFEIAPPFYRTWWFILASLVFVYLSGSWLYRYRVNQLLKIERVRNKIATDLHDDIGSALSSISIFSEVADQQLKQEGPHERTREIVGHISYHSRAMLDAMDDIVWAVNPKNDHFNDLSVRMREFAIPLLEARDIKFDISVEETLHDTRLSMEVRKNIYLIFKECINNILKHAAATSISVSIQRIQNQVEFLISDNGKGFTTGAASNRNGLKNLEKRAAEINGTVQIISAPGNGTTIKLMVNII